jgi:fluoride exporter
MSEYSFIFYACLAIAGSLGACLRYGMDRLLHQMYSTSFPSGIMLVNLTGAFFIGWLAAASVSGWVTDPAFQVLSLGFAGSYTTFSGWMVQTMELLMAGDRNKALANLLFTIIPGWLLTLAGWWLGMMLHST